MKLLKGKRLFLKFHTYDKNENSIVFNVILNNGIYLGDIILQYINMQRRCASIGMRIDNRGNRGNGYGTEAGKLLLNYGFNDLGLRRIEADTMENNVAGQRSLEKIGLVLEYKKRKAKFSEGQWVDVFYYGILREEYNNY